MEKKDQGIFREKSLERVSSPEQLDAYLKVTSVSVWMILVTIIVLLAGVIVWGYFGTLETTRSGACSINSNVATCKVTDDEVDNIKEGMELVIEDKSYPISNVEVDLDANTDNFELIIKAPCDLKDGAYKGKVIIESISPLKFVFN